MFQESDSVDCWHRNQLLLVENFRKVFGLQGQQKQVTDKKDLDIVASRRSIAPDFCRQFVFAN